jgi:hypothetical protein
MSRAVGEDRDAVQAFVSLAILGLVIARAVNIFA